MSDDTAPPVDPSEHLRAVRSIGERLDRDQKELSDELAIEAEKTRRERVSAIVGLVTIVLLIGAFALWIWWSHKHPRENPDIVVRLIKQAPAPEVP